MDILELICTCLLTSVLTGIFFYLMLNYTVNKFGQNLLSFFDKGIVKRGMSILGKQSGDSRRQKAAENAIAQGFIDKQLGGIKLIADKVLGINIDEMVEEYGAVEVLNAAQTFLPMLKNMGIDVNSVLGQIAQQTPQTSNTEF